VSAVTEARVAELPDVPVGGPPPEPVRDERFPAGRPAIFIAHPSDMLTDHLPNGDGLVAFGFIDRLAARGWRLHVAVRRADLRGPLPPNVTLHPIGDGRQDGLASRLRYMADARRLLRRLRRDEPIGLVHQMNPVFAGLSLGLLGCGLPVVLGTYVARWPDETEPRGPAARLRDSAARYARWCINFAQQAQASALLMTTPAAADRIALPAAWSQRRMRTVRHGIDTTLFRPDADWAERQRGMPPSILFYAQVDRRKGVLVLVEAFCRVAQAVPESRLTIVGRGDHVPEVERAVAEAGLGHRVTLAGRVERHQAPELFRAHAVYCLPSFGEPYATTLLEAMACARPVVVTDAGGLPHMMPEDGGLRVPVGDPDALAGALIALLGSPERRAAMGAVNYTFIQEHCAWDRVVDGLEAVYAEMLQIPARADPAARR
jgi:glycosyltransferase involved in cell wall biosynthesis